VRTCRCELRVSARLERVTEAGDKVYTAARIDFVGRKEIETPLNKNRTRARARGIEQERVVATVTVAASHVIVTAADRESPDGPD
jgi:hypothetical protein